MLQEFWSYFMTTGQIDMYLNYKAYEQSYHHNNSSTPPLPEEE